MAVLALQRAALHEKNKADARTINGAKGVKGMYASFHRSAPLSMLHRAVESTMDHIKLLLPGQLNKVHRIAGYTNRQLWIILRMLHGIQQLARSNTLTFK